MIVIGVIGVIGGPPATPPFWCVAAASHLGVSRHLHFGRGVATYIVTGHILSPATRYADVHGTYVPATICAVNVGMYCRRRQYMLHQGIVVPSSLQ